MKKLALALTLVLVAAGTAAAADPRVAVKTNLGSFVIELYPDKAPVTVESFLEGVDSGFYAGTIFHRVIRDFMVQGGGMTQDMRLKPTDKALSNEADNGLQNVRGAVAMARKGDPHSASVQFFVNTVDNAYLDHTAKTQRGWGYTVFGKVVEGMEVIDAIEMVRTARDVPVTPVVIESISRVEPQADEAAPEE